MLRNSKALALLAAVMALVVAAPRVADAATTTGTFTVTAAVVKNCVVATNNINLGSYDPTSGTQLATTANVSVTCTKNTSGVSIALSSANGWNLRDSATPANNIPYKIFQGATATDWTTTPWSGLTFASNVAQNYGATAKPNVGVDVPVGTYNDTVTVTVTF
jgi:spore coat protein U-like protein